MIRLPLRLYHSCKGQFSWLGHEGLSAQELKVPLVSSFAIEYLHQARVPCQDTTHTRHDM